jgi:hypothetical protein
MGFSKTCYINLLIINNIWKHLINQWMISSKYISLSPLFQPTKWHIWTRRFLEKILRPVLRYLTTNAPITRSYIAHGMQMLRYPLTPGRWAYHSDDAPSARPRPSSTIKTVRAASELARPFTFIEKTNLQLYVFTSRASPRINLSVICLRPR